MSVDGVPSMRIIAFIKGSGASILLLTDIVIYLATTTVFLFERKREKPLFKQNYSKFQAHIF